uniref:C2H2-type domain-containing protein n=1 Tax=Caenorhabditis tropicalis TaxID=1561998 RepID=A0A1I7V555_9PELO
MCSENLEAEGSHFYKHFKYKRYACGENSCDSEFYTEVERNEHCSKKGHKRSFQKTVNPYMEKMVAMVVEDARALATKDMDAVIESRWGGDEKLVTEITTKKKAQECDTTKKKRSIGTTSSSTATSSNTPAKKKAKSFIATPAASTSKQTTSPFAFLSNTSSVSSHRTNDSLPQASSSSNQSNQSVVDSTTNDLQTVSFDKPTPPSRKTRKKADCAELQKKSLENSTYDQMSAVEKLLGWYDPNVPERRAKVKCAVCNSEVVYDFIIRRGHVTRCHMSADIDERDYAQVLTAAMNKSYPDLPNTNLACQLCMTGVDIRSNKRREHIEKNHTTSLPPLICPIEKCSVGFRRQCDLSTHMKEHHKTSMSVYKDSNFQMIRRRRNVMINEMINKCFPWSALEAIENKTAAVMEKEASSQHRPIDFNFDRDVRIRDANRTRRAPQYNTTESSSSSDSEDDGASGVVSETGAVADFEQDVIYIGQQFNTEVSLKLSQRGNTPMIQVKNEVIDVEDVILNETPANVPVKEEEEAAVAEPPKNEDCSAIQSTNLPVIGPRSIYEPIVPPPSSPSSLSNAFFSTPNVLMTTTEVQNIPIPERILNPITNIRPERIDRSEFRSLSREPYNYSSNDRSRYHRDFDSNKSSHRPNNNSNYRNVRAGYYSSTYLSRHSYPQKYARDHTPSSHARSSYSEKRNIRY